VYSVYEVRRPTCRTDRVRTSVRCSLSHPSVFQHSEAYPRFSRMSSAFYSYIHYVTFLIFYAPFLLCSLLLSFSVFILALIMLLPMAGYSEKGQLSSWLCSFLLNSSLLALHPIWVLFCIRLDFHSLFGVSLSRAILESQHSRFV